MGHNAPRLPVGFQAKNVTDAHWAGQPVVVWCLACGHSRSADAWHIFRARGNLIFGTLQRGFFCGGCRRSSIVTVLPCDAPNPKDWCADQRAGGISDDEKRRILLETEHLPYRIDAWSADGSLEKLMAKVKDFSLAGEVFKIARRQNNQAARMTLREGVIEITSTDHPVA